MAPRLNLGRCGGGGRRQSGEVVRPHPRGVAVAREDVFGRPQRVSVRFFVSRCGTSRVGGGCVLLPLIRRCVAGCGAVSCGPAWIRSSRRTVVVGVLHSVIVALHRQIVLSATKAWVGIVVDNEHSTTLVYVYSHVIIGVVGMTTVNVGVVISLVNVCADALMRLRFSVLPRQIVFTSITITVSVSVSFLSSGVVVSILVVPSVIVASVVVGSVVVASPTPISDKIGLENSVE